MVENMVEEPEPYFPPKKEEKAKIPRFPRISKRQLILAVLIVLSCLGAAIAVDNIISNTISTTLEVQAPESVNIASTSWPSPIVRGLNYTFNLTANNPNPPMPAIWRFNFTRADGIQSGDIDIYLKVGDNYVKLNKQLADGVLMFSSPVVTLPNGSKRYDFKIISFREGSYSVSMYLVSAS